MKVYWDAMLFIYVFESNQTYATIVRSILEAMHRRGDSLLTSVFTLGEVLVGPRKLGSISSSDRVKAYFASGSIEVLPFTLDTAEQFASIRAWTRVQSADAIHLASASLAQVDLLLTNDSKLQNLSVPGIRRVAGLDPKVIQMLFP